MNIVEPSIKGTFDHSSPLLGSYDNTGFQLIGSNGTVAIGSLTDNITPAFNHSSALVAFKTEKIDTFVIELIPRPPLEISANLTGSADVNSPSDIFKFDLIGSYAVTSSDGTRPAPIIYHTGGVASLGVGFGFFDPGLRRSGLIYPRHYNVIRNRAASTVITSLGFITLKDVRVATQRTFYIYQTYPTNLF